MAKIVIQLKTWMGASDYMFILGGHEVDYQRDFKDADILLADTTPISFDELKAATKLKGIVRPGVGHDNVPLGDCGALGIVAAYTPNAMSQSVAELAFGMILSALRHTHMANKLVHLGFWDRLMGRELADISVGVIGLGRIGKRLVAMLAPHVERIYGFDPIQDTTFDEIHGVDRVQDMDELLSMSDVVSLHIPRTPANMGLIGSRELTLMPDCGIIVNTSRGGLICERDLLHHLGDNPGFLACLDVLEYEGDRQAESDELIDGGCPALRDCTNAIITAHMGSMTHRARATMEKQGIEAALAILGGKPPAWVIPKGMVLGYGPYINTTEHGSG